MREALRTRLRGRCPLRNNEANVCSLCSWKQEQHGFLLCTDRRRIQNELRAFFEASSFEPLPAPRPF